MRHSVAFLLLVALLIQPGCEKGDSEGPEPLFIGDFQERSPVVSCRALADAPRGAPTSLVSVSDSTFLVNFGLERVTRLLDHELRELARVRYEKEGPLGMIEPRGMALVDDSVIVFADRPSLRLKSISLSGRDLGASDLDFPPESLLPFRGGLLVTQTILTDQQDELIFFHSPEGGSVPLGVSPTSLPDPQLNTLANLTVLLDLGGGEAAALHQFLVPRSTLVIDSSTGSWRSLPDTSRSLPRWRTRGGVIPLPDGVRSSVGWRPSRPFTDDEILRILTPALAADVDRAAGDVLVLTRTGRSHGGASEKAVIRLDRALSFQSAIRLPVNAGHLITLGRGDSMLVIDDLDRWHACPAP